MKTQYIKRFFFCIMSLMLFAFGNVFGVKAAMAGTNAWNTLSLGISSSTGISFGTATFLISLVIIVIDLLGKGKLGFGTVLNAVLIPVFSDAFLSLLSWIPPAANPVWGAAYTLAGQTIISFATVFYMLPALGCGPRDTLMIIIGRRFPRAPIGVVKFCLEAGALAFGFLMGAPFGIGTVLVMLLQASLFQLACRAVQYEPRSVSHEDILCTFKKLTGKA
ncbi:MAG: hypothetical protein IJ381_07620 [Clostridia bacterium]|nr:hypothetical protein [Clostridia bacterium]